MGEQSWNFAEVRFIDWEAVIRDLREAAAEAKSRYPEIRKVLLFGSLVQGSWTADSDADLIVVVDKEFPDILSRSPYQVSAKSIPTDTLVYSTREFEQLARDASSLVAQNLSTALEL